jgi:hypothetical protein
MASTREQREAAGICGATKRNGDPCRAIAGTGTRHPGSGACKFHGGNTPNHDKAAIRREVTKQMVMLGTPDDSVTALDAMTSELYASSGHCGFLRQQLNDMSKDELGTPYGQTVAAMYNAERDRRVRIAKLCIEAGVDEATIRLAEGQVALLGNALARAADTAGLSGTVRKRLGAALRDELAAIEAQPALTAGS